MNSPIQVVEPDEIDDAYSLIINLGFRSKDFEIGQRPNPSPPRPALITGKVTVTRKCTGRAKSYAAGDRSAWLTQLEKDLNANAFGPPVVRP